MTCRDETISADPKVIREQAALFYSKLFNSAPESKENYPTVSFKVLNNAGSHLLDRPFFIEELQCVVQQASPDKVPGPEGFTMGFFQRAWDMMKDDLWDAILFFYQGGQLLSEINYSFIALIQKSKASSFLGDFRPIACCNVLYNILSKMLSNRLQLGHRGTNFFQSDNFC